MEKSEEEIIRAVALSGLITIYSKHYTGRLSALCGCVLGGGSGAAAGIVLLMGGGATTEETFNPDIFSTMRTAVGPGISFIGLVIRFFAILYKMRK